MTAPPRDVRRLLDSIIFMKGKGNENCNDDRDDISFSRHVRLPIE
jgi:hypothetical protein